MSRVRNCDGTSTLVASPGSITSIGAPGLGTPPHRRRLASSVHRHVDRSRESSAARTRRAHRARPRILGGRRIVGPSGTVGRGCNVLFSFCPSTVSPVMCSRPPEHRLELANGSARRRPLAALREQLAGPSPGSPATPRRVGDLVARRVRDLTRSPFLASTKNCIPASPSSVYSIFNLASSTGSTAAAPTRAPSMGSASNAAAPAATAIPVRVSPSTSGDLLSVHVAVWFRRRRCGRGPLAPRRYQIRPTPA